MQHLQPQRPSRPSPNPSARPQSLPISGSSPVPVFAADVVSGPAKASADVEDRRDGGGGWAGGRGEAAGVDHVKPLEPKPLLIQVHVQVSPGLGLLARLAVLSARLCRAHVLHVERMGEQYVAQSIEIETAINCGAVATLLSEHVSS